MGDIDRVVALVTAAMPPVRWDKGDPRHPDLVAGRWGVVHPQSYGKVHINSATGMCPFVVETTSQSEDKHCQSIQETADTVVTFLKLLPSRSATSDETTAPFHIVKGRMVPNELYRPPKEPPPKFMPGKKPKPLSEVFEIDDPSEFYEALGLHLDYAAEERMLSGSEHAIFALRGLEGEVANGAFEQFFHNGAGNLSREALHGLDMIGAAKMAAIVRKAMSPFPDGAPSPDQTTRWKQIEALGDAPEALWHAVTHEFDDYPDDISSLVWKYCKEHRKEFGGEM